MICAFRDLWQRRPWSTAYCAFAIGGILSTIFAQWAGVL